MEYADAIGKGEAESSNLSGSTIKITTLPLICDSLPVRKCAGQSKNARPVWHESGTQEIA